MVFFVLKKINFLILHFFIPVVQPTQLVHVVSVFIEVLHAGDSVVAHFFRVSVDHCVTCKILFCCHGKDCFCADKRHFFSKTVSKINTTFYNFAYNFTFAKNGHVCQQAGKKLTYSLYQT